MIRALTECIDNLFRLIFTACAGKFANVHDGWGTKCLTKSKGSGNKLLCANGGKLRHNGRYTLTFLPVHAAHWRAIFLLDS